MKDARLSTLLACQAESEKLNFRAKISIEFLARWIRLTAVPQRCCAVPNLRGTVRAADTANHDGTGCIIPRVSTATPRVFRSQRLPSIRASRFICGILAITDVLSPFERLSLLRLLATRYFYHVRGKWPSPAPQG